jgi:hypothetical protein
MLRENARKNSVVDPGKNEFTPSAVIPSMPGRKIPRTSEKWSAGKKMTWVYPGMDH